MGIFNGMETKRGRPPKKPRRTQDRRHADSADARRRSSRFESAAESDDAKPVTWAREVLLRAAKRRSK